MFRSMFYLILLLQYFKRDTPEYTLNYTKTSPFSKSLVIWSEIVARATQTLSPRFGFQITRWYRVAPSALPWRRTGVVSISRRVMRAWYFEKTVSMGLTTFS